MTTSTPPTEPNSPAASDRFGTSRGARLLGRLAAASVPVLVSAAAFVWVIPPAVLVVAAFTYLLGVPASYPLEVLARRRPAGLAPTVVYTLAGTLLGAPLGVWMSWGAGEAQATASMVLSTAACGALAATLASTVGPRIRGRWRWLAVTLGLVTVVVAMVVSDAMMNPSPRPAPPADAYDLSALDRPRTDADGLPAAALMSPDADMLADPADVRFARASHGLVLYVEVGADDRPCLVEHPEGAPEDLRVVCAEHRHDPPLVLEHTTVADDHPDQASPTLTRMLITDGHDTYQHHWGRAQVINNVAVLGD